MSGTTNQGEKSSPNRHWRDLERFVQKLRNSREMNTTPTENNDALEIDVVGNSSTGNESDTTSAYEDVELLCNESADLLEKANENIKTLAAVAPLAPWEVRVGHTRKCSRRIAVENPKGKTPEKMETSVQTNNATAEVVTTETASLPPLTPSVDSLPRGRPLDRPASAASWRQIPVTVSDPAAFPPPPAILPSEAALHHVRAPIPFTTALSIDTNQTTWTSQSVPQPNHTSTPYPVAAAYLQYPVTPRPQLHPKKRLAANFHNESRQVSLALASALNELDKLVYAVLEELYKAAPVIAKDQPYDQIVRDLATVRQQASASKALAGDLIRNLSHNG